MKSTSTAELTTILRVMECLLQSLDQKIALRLKMLEQSALLRQLHEEKAGPATLESTRLGLHRNHQKLQDATIEFLCHQSELRQLVRSFGKKGGLRPPRRKKK